MNLDNSKSNYWVFGYGSLMWNPGFKFCHRISALLVGWHRDMCIKSIHYRGTPNIPGLVSGLVPGGDCLGFGYEIAQQDVNEVIEYLDARELITMVYCPMHLEIELADGRNVEARVYISNQNHPHFAGNWSDKEKIIHLVQGRGTEGTSLEYLENILGNLEKLGIFDNNLDRLLKMANGHLG